MQLQKSDYQRLFKLTSEALKYGQPDSPGFKELKELSHKVRSQIEKSPVPAKPEDWKIEQVDRYYYASARNYWTYKEVTYWYEVHTTKRKETVRQATIPTDGECNLPEWAKCIIPRRKFLESEL